MEVLAKNRFNKVYKTDYKPQFGYNSLISLLKDNNLNLGSCGKSKSTNSYYIESWSDDETKQIEIRISNHTKFQESDIVESLIHIDNDNWLIIDIIDSDGFQSAKNEIVKYLKYSK